jgi:hypothetical protein
MAAGTKHPASGGGENSGSDIEDRKSTDDVILPSDAVVKLFVHLCKRGGLVIRKGLVEDVQLEAMVIRSMTYVQTKDVNYKWASSDWFVEGKQILCDVKLILTRLQDRSRCIGDIQVAPTLAYAN